MPTLSNGIVYQDLGTHDAAEYAEYARQERERRRQAQQNAAPSPQPAPQQNSVPKTVPDRGPDVKTAPSAPMDAAEQTRRSQLQDGARSAYENYLGSYASQAQNEEKNIAQTGKSVMDTAYVFNEAWNAVKNNTAFAGNIEQQQAFVTNAAISFANASAVAHGWELVDQANVDGKNAWTGYNSQTGTWDFVFRDKNGNFFTKHTTMDQVASQLKNNGYYPDDADKSKDKGGKGGDETPASAGKGGETKPPAELNVGDISKRYSGFYTKTYDENGKETGVSLSEEGEQFMLGELESATGVERRYLLNAIASNQARIALADAKKNWNPNGGDPEPTFKSEYDKALQDLKKNYADPSSAETSGNQAPSDALEAFAKSVAIGKTNDAEVKSAGLGESFKRLSDARTERQEAQRAAAANARRERSVYVNGRWVKQGDIDDGKVTVEAPDGEFVNGIRMDALNAKKAENKTRDSDKKLVSDFDAMLKRYNDEDDATIRQFEQGDNLLSEREYLDNIRKQDIAREKEMLAVVREMSPKQRQAILRERDDQGHFTERARRMRSALLYARDMGSTRRTLANGEPVRTDASETDRDAEVAALAAVDMNEARRNRTNKDATTTETNGSNGETQEPAPQEPVAVAPDTTEPAPVQEEAPQAQNEASAEVVSQQELPTVEPPANESTVSNPENKPSAASAEEADKIERDAIRDNAIKSVDSFFTRARGAGQNPDTPDERRAKIKSAFQGAKTVLNDNLEDYGNGNVRVANSWRGERKAALSALFGAVGAKKTGGKFVMTRKQYEMAVDLLDNWIESMD